MALIAPGAFLWLTFVIQAGTGVAGQPSTAPSIVDRHLRRAAALPGDRCFLRRNRQVWPGTGSSYYYAEQAMLSKDKAFKYARVAKFIVGWARTSTTGSIQAWMVAVTGIFVGYVVGFLYPNFLSGSNPGPVFMGLVAVVFSFFVAWIAAKGAGGIDRRQHCHQRGADFGAHRLQRAGARLSRQPPAGTPAFQYDGQSMKTFTYQFATNPKDSSILRDANGDPLPLLDNSGKPVPFTIDYPTTDSTGNFLTHPNAASVIGVHKFQFYVHSGNVAILISGRIRIGHLDGRRGQESNQAYTDCRDRIAAHPGIVLLPV